MSDGTPTLSQWVQAAQAKGYRYLGISDHSQSAAYAGGLKADQLKQQEEEIRTINERKTGSISSGGSNPISCLTGLWIIPNRNWPASILSSPRFIPVSI